MGLATSLFWEFYKRSSRMLKDTQTQIEHFFFVVINKSLSSAEVHTSCI